MNGPELIKRYKKGKRDFREYRFVNVKLRNANLQRINLQGCNLTGADLRGANLSHSNLRGVNLARAKLRGATLSRVDLSRANLNGADLTGANLNHAHLYKTDLQNANLSGSYLGGVNKLSVIHNEHTIWPAEKQDEVDRKSISKSGFNKEGVEQSFHESRDGSKYLGHYRRDHGQFGSFPLHDDYDEDSDVE